MEDDLDMNPRHNGYQPRKKSRRNSSDDYVFSRAYSGKRKSRKTGKRIAGANIATLVGAKRVLGDGGQIRVAKDAAQLLSKFANKHGDEKAQCVSRAANMSARLEKRKTVKERDVKVAILGTGKKL